MDDRENSPGNADHAQNHEHQLLAADASQAWGSPARRSAVLVILKFDKHSPGGAGGRALADDEDRRHAEILDQMMLGNTRDKTIATALGMPVKTVRTHIARMRKATGTHDKAALIAYVARLGNAVGWGESPPFPPRKK